MDEILSQAEIDNLLRAMGSGEMRMDQMSPNPPMKVKTYDFKRPNKFSKDHINTLHNIFDNYSRALATNLSGAVHLTVETQLLSIEQITYSEFMRSLPNPTITGIAELSPLGTAFFDISPSLAFILVDLLLGGSGESVNDVRDLTQIERQIIEKRLRVIIDLMPEAWENIVPMTSKFLAIETNPQFVQIVAPTEMVALITIEVKCANGMGFVHTCLPYLILEAVLPKLSTQVWYTNKLQVVSERETILANMDKVALEVKAILGTAVVNVSELLSLAVGDVLPLDKKISDPMEVLIGPDPKFYGFPGLCGGRLAVQLTSRVGKGDEDVE